MFLEFQLRFLVQKMSAKWFQMVKVNPALFQAHFEGATKSAWPNYQKIDRLGCGLGHWDSPGPIHGPGTTRAGLSLFINGNHEWSVK